MGAKEEMYLEGVQCVCGGGREEGVPQMVSTPIPK